MSAATGDQLPAPTRLSSLGTRPPEQELQLPCPRCNSTNTKFCYYNNYNLSQPRHYCKGCRRYWTRGGTLRNVPVGGGSRKASTSSSSNKRARIVASTNLSSSGPTTPTSTASSSSEIVHENPNLNPISITQQMIPGSGSGRVSGLELGSVNGSLGEGFTVNLNEAVPEALSLSSFLTAQVGGGGYMPFGPGFGIDSGPGMGMGMHGVGYGLGLLDWPLENVCQLNGDGGGSGGDVGGGGGDAGGGGGEGEGGGSGGGSPGCNTWQMGGLEGGLPDGDCFGWPDLAISMTAKGLK